MKTIKSKKMKSVVKAVKQTGKKIKMVLSWEPSPSDSVAEVTVTVNQNGKKLFAVNCDPDQDHVVVELVPGNYNFMVESSDGQNAVRDSVEYAFYVAKDAIAPATNLAAYIQPQEEEDQKGTGKLPDFPADDDAVPCGNKAIDTESKEDNIGSFEQGLAALERAASGEDEEEEK